MGLKVIIADLIKDVVPFDVIVCRIDESRLYQDRCMAAIHEKNGLAPNQREAVTNSAGHSTVWNNFYCHSPGHPDSVCFRTKTPNGLVLVTVTRAPA